MSEQNFEIEDEELLDNGSEPLARSSQNVPNPDQPDPTLLQEIPSGSFDIKTDKTDSLQITNSQEEMSASDMIEEKKVSF